MLKFKTFSYTDAFKFAFSKYMDNFLLFLGITLTFAALFIAAAILFLGLGIFTSSFSYVSFVPVSTSYFPNITLITQEPNNYRLIFTGGLFYVLTLYVLKEFYYYQLIRYGLSFYEHTPLKWSDFFGFDFTQFLKFIGARLLYVIKIILGLICLIIPGLYMVAKYFFSGFSLVDDKTHSIHEDKKMAAALSSEIMWSVFWFAVITGLLFGALSGFITIFLAPIPVLAQVHAYKKLSSYYEESKEGTVVNP